MTNNEFIEEIAKYVNKYRKDFGIAVASPIIAQACLESAYGTSDKAKFHNYFGMKYRSKRLTCNSGIVKAGGSEQLPNGSYVPIAADWYAFDSMEMGVLGYFQFINIPNYYNLKGITDPKTYLELIKSDGYATSLKYVDNLMRVIEDNNLTRFDVEDKPLNINTSIRCNPYRVGLWRSKKSIKYIVIHYTANTTDTARNNALYFKTNTKDKASAHYIVDDNDIYESIPVDKIANAVGGSKWNDCAKTGGGKMYGKITNANSVSIELCSKNGNITQQTLTNAIALAEHLCWELGLDPAKCLYRHFDVNGKHCPGWTLNTQANWDGFKWCVTDRYIKTLEWLKSLN